MRAKELIEDPVQEDELAEAIGILVSQVLKRSQARTPGNGTVPASSPDRLLEIDQAAERLQVSRSWLYRRSGKLPFAVHNGRRLAFSEKGIEAYIQRNMGKP